MASRRLTLFLVLTLAILAIGGGGAYWASRLPTASAQLPSHTAPMLVTLSRPLDRTSYPANSYVPVLAKARSTAPLRALELWVNGEMVERSEYPSGSIQQSVSWTWRPSAQGEYRILARAFDSDGAVGDSNLVRLSATKETVPLILHTAVEGDSLAALAARAGLTVEQVALANPDVPRGGPLPGGQYVYLPFSANVSAAGVASETATSTTGAPPGPGSMTANPTAAVARPPLSGREVKSSEPNSVSLLVEKLTGAPAKRPAAPSILASATGCDAAIQITDSAGDEDGFFVYRLAPNSTAFQRIATLGSAAGSSPLIYWDRGRVGSNQYYVSSFNLAGENPSNIAAVAVDESSCGEQSPEKQPPGSPSFRQPRFDPAPSDLRLEGGNLVLPEGMERVYGYLSIDRGPWSRLPADPGGFFHPVAGGFQVGGLLDALLPSAEGSEVSIDLEVWGWRDGSLVRVGELSRTITAPQRARATPGISVAKDLLLPRKGIKPGQWFSDGSTLTLCATGPQSCKEGMGALVTEGSAYAADASYSYSEFNWSTESFQADSGVWQISRLPFPTQFDAGPPGLIAQGVVAGKGGKFPLDLAEILGLGQAESSPSAGSTSQSGGAVVKQVDPQRLSILAGGGTAGEEALKPLLAGRIAGGVANWPKLNFPYYVRITPMKGTVPVGVPSNSVTVHVGHQPDGEVVVIQDGPPGVEMPPPLLYDITGVSFTPMKAPVDALWQCVRVVKNEAEPDPMQPFTYLKAGTVLCPEPYKGSAQKPWYESLWDFVANLANWASQAFEALKNIVVGVVAGLIPGCGEGSACWDVLQAGLDVGLVALGIPPDLPNFDELASMGMDYLVEYAVGLAGGPCDLAPDVCASAIREGLSLAVRNSQSNTSCMDVNAAHNLAIEPLCLPGYIVTEPVEGSRAVPASVVVAIQRKPNTPQIKGWDQYKVSISAGVSGYNDVFVGKTIPMEYLNYENCGNCPGPTEMVTITKPFEGDLFQSKWASLNWPAADQPQTLKVPFGGLAKADYWIPEHLDLIEKHGDWYMRYDDWWDLYYSGTAKVNVGVTCILEWQYGGTTHQKSFACAAPKEAHFPLPTGSGQPVTTQEVKY